MMTSKFQQTEKMGILIHFLDPKLVHQAYGLFAAFPPILTAFTINRSLGEPQTARNKSYFPLGDDGRIPGFRARGK
jgi:hypothetical protein